ncbi:TMV resistance protein N-like [Ipomoea triloba]|uniref:TMV resistance protein N-like n=1 Tax=Ipomoea triloba TaxID=35885 RepID=UPI00125D9527|nr:TMV resistance protein N-like [Ipomoea triloba]
MATPAINLESSAWEYDVFLSFRGETRKSFTNDLYCALCRAGVRTFRDDDELRKGEDLSSEFKRAIRSSRIAVIVLSQDYASSRWCLDELLQILDCKEKRKQTVFPVFYGVEASQVQNQSGNYGVALAKHERRFGASKVQTWRDALTKVGNLSGLDLRDAAINGNESKFINTIIEKVQLVVGRRVPMFVAKHVVGLDSQVQHVVQLIHREPNDGVCMIGIHGMGGIGKTTLAKAVYNRLFGYFDSSCFLEIRSGISEIENLQEELLSKILKREIKVGSKDEGIVLIKQWLQAKKCLIVLDNLEYINQFNALCGQRDWFGVGSRIILTTTEAPVLKSLKGEECYEAKVLNQKESLQLFSLHAFGEPSLPKEDYIELSDDLVAYCGGLPLALEVLGADLFDKSKEEWISAFEKLKRIPHNGIQDRLKIRYDRLLDDHTKSLFLDLVCFPYEVPIDTAISMFEAMGYSANIEIQHLVDKCLINYYGSQISMHSLIREMGKEIIRLESPDKPGERSRLWCLNDIHDVLVGHKGTTGVEVIVPNTAMKNMRYHTKAFKNMKKLRWLQIDHIHLYGGFNYLSKDLKILQWNHCPLEYIPSDFHFEKLVSLDMRGSNIKKFRASLKYFRCLKSLDFSFSKRLKETPSFGGAQNLEIVSFRACSSLVKVDSSIGELERLIRLDFRDCPKLKKLPNSLCQLRSLQILDVYNCTKLKELPKELGNLIAPLHI